MELFEWVSPDQRRPEYASGWHRFSDVGNSYISFTVRDMDATLAHIRRHVLPRWPGTRLIQDPPMQFPLRGEVCTSTFLVSPWGMWIELTHWSQASQHPAASVVRAQAATAHPLVGQPLSAVPTPALVVDLDVVDFNVGLMAERMRAAGVQWRPPVKAHKCPELTRYIGQRGGTQGIVVLTLAEAEAFVGAGADDIFLHNQLATPAEWRRLAALNKRGARVRVCVDAAENVHDLAAAATAFGERASVEVLVEVNVGHNRCGVQPDQAAALAQVVRDEEQRTGGAVRFVGLTGYEGHTPVLPPAEKTAETRACHAKLRQARERVEACGIPVAVVTGGGSCNYVDALATGVLTEVQAGGGVLCDLLYYDKAGLRAHGHRLGGALVMTTVTSAAADGSRAMGDAGFKACGWHPFGGLPRPRDHPQLDVAGLSAEHTKLIPQPGTPCPRRGDRLLLHLGYTDAAGFLHRRVIAARGDTIESVWPTVSDRAWGAAL